MKQFFLVTYSILSLLSLQAQHPVVPAAEVPFDLVQNHVIVQVEINDRKLPFAIDSKTKGMFLYKWAVKKFDLEMKPKDKYEGGRDSLVTGKVKIDRAHISTIFFEPGKLWVYENTPYFKYLGQPIAGVIGSSLFQEFIVHFDFDRDTLSLYDPKTFTPDPAMSILPLKISRGSALVKMDIELPDKTLEGEKVMLSTATDKTVMVKYKIGKKSGLFSKDNPRHKDIGTEFPGHFFRASRSYRTTVDFLGEEFTEVPTTVSHDKKAFAKEHWFDDVMVGTRFLSNFNFTLDYIHRKAYFKKNKRYAATFTPNKSGLILKRDLRKDKLIVHYVIPGSPAKEAGVKVGDELVSIYKEAVQQYTMDEVEEILSINSNMIELHVRREETVYRIKFRLSDSY